MSTTSKLAEVFRSSLDHPAGGVVGLVNDLLTICQQQELQLDWQADYCRIRSIASGAEEVIDSPVRMSVFRAILARVATVCNEQIPNSISPYGGQGEVAVGAGSDTILRVVLTNTASEQRLRLTPERPNNVMA